MDLIDQLLAKLNPNSAGQAIPQKTSEEISPPKSSNRSIDDLLKSLGESAKQSVRERLQSTPTSTKSVPVPEIQEYQQEQVSLELLAQEKQQKQALLYQQQRAALEQQRRQDLQIQAETWLQKLDRQSVEGRWFDDFACHYESRLEAAIEYLVALQEVNF
jgi:hypothetical protein